QVFDPYEERKNLDDMRAVACVAALVFDQRRVLEQAAAAVGRQRYLRRGADVASRRSHELRALAALPVEYPKRAMKQRCVIPVAVVVAFPVGLVSNLLVADQFQPAITAHHVGQRRPEVLDVGIERWSLVAERDEDQPLEDGCTHMLQRK